MTAGLAIVGRFCVNITFNIGLQYGAELIPTAVRAQGIAYVHIAGYVAAIISPYIVDLVSIDTSTVNHCDVPVPKIEFELNRLDSAGSYR